MPVQVQIVNGAVPPADAEASLPGAGSRLVFEGLVRGIEGDREIVALEYETYDPMAERELRRLAHHAVNTHGLLSFEVVHSRGIVAVGACAVRVVVWSKHRAEGLAALSEFLDKMKQDVPIWKKV